MATWPSSLPNFELNAEVTQQQGFIRTQTSTGPFKQRRRFSAVTKTFTGTIFLNGTQYSTFRTFYDTTLGQGGATFTFEDPTDSFNTGTFRFVEVPTETLLIGGASGVDQYRISMKLEKLP